MKRLAYLVPAIVFTVVYGLAALGGIESIHPIVILWLASFWAAGILLSKGIVWGGLLGFFPAACFLYMGTQETGQIINETPVGIVVLLYYAVCMYCVYKKRRAGSR